MNDWFGRRGKPPEGDPKTSWRFWLVVSAIVVALLLAKVLT